MTLRSDWGGIIGRGTRDGTAGGTGTEKERGKHGKARGAIARHGKALKGTGRHRKAWERGGKAGSTGRHWNERGGMGRHDGRHRERETAGTERNGRDTGRRSRVAHTRT